MNKKQIALLEITVIYFIVAVGGYSAFQYFKEKPLVLRMLYADLAMTVVTYMFSVIKKNSSVYDAYWSVIPFYFILQYFYLFDGADWSAPQWICAIVVSLWSWRLTLSWARGWSGWEHEDFRYVSFRHQFKAFFQPINFLAIHLYPTLIVFASMWGLQWVYEAGILEIGWLFYLGAATAFVGTIFEYLADNELAKFRLRPNKKKDDILRTGIWAKSRNPNYLGEMMFWFGVAMMGTAYAAPWYTVLGSVGMWMMFMFASIPLKDKQMMKNRPESFQKYKKEVARVLPF
ncbi:DUF1295 domain-containing protein [Flammeovirga kamogawensis]|uniref:DUF1295 domain-containing protein n=1 Tax=Flammeovirga kamogawensis TaxID=373891 RepID=A0ABX8GZQ4_9BACT|nr:DUF1295 domain-containing protein [Flammeovirga kamogawensis]MBB6459339.1 steroid 5-alpha reductase family enzyme [Flammeovirga kamogawensis]QWG08898.1 DUF1295 domain-containing protein [Flammeovirga kamogawensis]TRX67188.1 DUF1295 domain-containing protein [Flammeovirga kamogawensis]